MLLALVLSLGLSLPQRPIRAAAWTSRPAPSPVMGPTSGDPIRKMDFKPVPRPPARGGSPMPQLLAQNKRWAAEVAKTPGLFDRLRQHQPKYLWIGCSDARVPSNQLLGLGPGEVFVQRNIANLVVNVDTNLMSVIQYAVDVLKVSDIIVCGHYECGGVRAAMTNTNHGSPLENWLRNIRDVVRLHAHELKAIADPEARYRRLVELNAMEQTLNVYKTHCVQRARAASASDTAQQHVVPRVHAVVYDPLGLELKELDVDLEIEDYEEVYKLYPTAEAAMHHKTGSEGARPEYFV
ncbi:hypothetical protein KFE25_010508 [Diacronema lutheri]|uniref:Carbonic anhydrase n=2 Tax=Diacronema lutheri TaxID=2081491 RepID=A0A8J5X597_DIALT|nr:hypothetical protein KFE25_010508 [Diacronema lutheri]